MNKNFYLLLVAVGLLSGGYFIHAGFSLTRSGSLQLSKASRVVESRAAPSESQVWFQGMGMIITVSPNSPKDELSWLKPDSGNDPVPSFGGASVQGASVKNERLLSADFSGLSKTGEEKNRSSVAQVSRIEIANRVFSKTEGDGLQAGVMPEQKELATETDTCRQSKSRKRVLQRMFRP